MLAPLFVSLLLVCLIAVLLALVIKKKVCLFFIFFFFLCVLIKFYFLEKDKSLFKIYLDVDGPRGNVFLVFKPYSF